MDSLGLEPESVDNLDMYNHIPPVLMEKCAALSVRPDTVKNLIQSMQGVCPPLPQPSLCSCSERSGLILSPLPVLPQGSRASSPTWSRR